jgi:3'(2'), 5'-bisphosphate nucleotidase
MQLSDYILPAVEAALLAGEQIRKIYKQVDYSIQFKEDNSPVTQADTLAHQAILSCLKSTETIIVSEEDANDDLTRYHRSLFWLIDPLDGTKDFIARSGEFGVNIALIENGEPVIGVVYLPILSELYFGQKGLGSFMIPSIQNLGQFLDKELDLIKLPIPTENSMISKPIFLQSRIYPNPINKQYVARLSEILHTDVALVDLGSTAKYIEIAKGSGWFYPRENSLHKWDLAAGDAIIRFSGGKVVDLQNGQSINYSTPENKIPPFLAVSSKALEKIPISELLLLFQCSPNTLK